MIPWSTSLSFTLPDAKDLPIVLNKGKIFLSKNKIAIEGVKGYHGKSTVNTIDIDGSITDYMKTCNTYIVSYVVLTKEFTNDYLTPLVGYPIELVGKTKSKIKFNMLNGKIDISLIFRLIEGYDLLLDGLSFTPTTYQRAFKADVSLDKDNIELKNLNYYIAKSFTSGVEAEPLLRVFGNFNANNGKCERHYEKSGKSIKQSERTQ